MRIRGGLPKPFGDSGTRAAGTSATRTALREFIPIALILVAVDLSTDGVILGHFEVIPNLKYPIPADVYVYAFLGAGAYAVTSLAFNPKQSIVETYHLTYRLIGALPLGAGIFILSELLVSQSDVPVPVVGLVFLSGLYVRLALRRLGDVAERLYGGQTDAAEAGQYRTEASDNVRHGWRHLSTSQPSEADRKTARDRLERAEAIIDDGDATVQELARARELSEQAMSALRPDENGQSERTVPQTPSDSDAHTPFSSESG